MRVQPNVRDDGHPDGRGQVPPPPPEPESCPQVIVPQVVVPQVVVAQVVVPQVAVAQVVVPQVTCVGKPTPARRRRQLRPYRDARQVLWWGDGRVHGASGVPDVRDGVWTKPTVDLQRLREGGGESEFGAGGADGGDSEFGDSDGGGTDELIALYSKEFFSSNEGKSLWRRVSGISNDNPSSNNLTSAYAEKSALIKEPCFTKRAQKFNKYITTAIITAILSNAQITDLIVKQIKEENRERDGARGDQEEEEEKVED